MLSARPPGPNGKRRKKNCSSFKGCYWFWLSLLQKMEKARELAFSPRRRGSRKSSAPILSGTRTALACCLDWSCRMLDRREAGPPARRARCRRRRRRSVRRRPLLELFFSAANSLSRRKETGPVPLRAPRELLHLPRGSSRPQCTSVPWRKEAWVVQTKRNEHGRIEQAFFSSPLCRRRSLPAAAVSKLLACLVLFRLSLLFFHPEGATPRKRPL